MDNSNIRKLHPKEKDQKSETSVSSSLSPREIVSELDRFVVGQNKAKKAVAVALRNRWRRQALKGEMKESWEKRQIYRTEVEMRIGVLEDFRHPTPSAKYWQSVREQNTHFENLVHLSFDARKNEVEIKKLQRDIKKEKDPLEKELKQVELEEKLYGKAQMELVAKHRMREVATWSKLKKEFDDGNFDKRDVNTHQAKSYLLRLQRQKETITPGTSQPEVFNVLGQLEALEKGLRENTLSLDAKKTKKLK